MTEKDNGYIYVLLTREFLNSGKSIYKIGRTNQESAWDRFKQYPIGFKVIFVRMVNDSINMELLIKRELKTTKELINRIDFGDEYFEGDINQIIKVCNDLCQKEDLTIQILEVNKEIIMEEIIIEERFDYREFIDEHLDSHSNPYTINSVDLYKEIRYLCDCVKNIKCPKKIDVENYIRKKSEELKRSVYSKFVNQCIIKDENSSIKLEKSYQCFKCWWIDKFNNEIPLRMEFKQMINEQLGEYLMGKGWCSYKLNLPIKS
jgi:hypothetical protein